MLLAARFPGLRQNWVEIRKITATVKSKRTKLTLSVSFSLALSVCVSSFGYKNRYTRLLFGANEYWCRNSLSLFSTLPFIKKQRKHVITIWIFTINDKWFIHIFLNTDYKHFIAIVFERGFFSLSFATILFANLLKNKKETSTKRVLLAFKLLFQVDENIKCVCTMKFLFGVDSLMFTSAERIEHPS